VIASDWAGGFLDAVALRPKAWEPLIKDRRAGVMLVPLLYLNGDADVYQGGEEAVDEEKFSMEIA
jgi:uncharacterized protein